MKNSNFIKPILLLVCAVVTVPAMAQFNLKKAISGATKAVSAATLTDEQMTEYVAEYIAWMDEHNQVCADDNEYTIRLKKLTEGLSDADGLSAVPSRSERVKLSISCLLSVIMQRI